MQVHIRAFVISCLIIAGSALSAQQPGSETITKEDLKRHLQIIASDSFEGRMTGSAGIEKAADYIESQLRSKGIASLNKNDEYRQNFSLYSTSLNAANTYFQFDLPGNKVRIDSIAILLPFDADKLIESELVFTGYGYVDPESGYNDFDNIDIEGKIVMYMTGAPNSSLPEEYEQLGFDPEEEGGKLGYIVGNGAKTVIVVIAPRFVNEYNKSVADLMSMTSQKMSFDSLSGTSDSFQFIVISTADAEQVFKAAGKQSLSVIQQNIDSTRLPASFEFNESRASLHIDLETEIIPAFNVAAVVEGCHKKLKDEHIVICAHYDHDGRDEQGNILNGADDNGSGTVGLLEIAEAFSLLPQKPKRSIVFLWFTGEERGLLGSKYFINNPLIPLDDIVSCINLDMIGRTRLPSDTIPSKGWGDIEVTDGDRIYVIHGNCNKKMLEINEKNCLANGLESDYSLNEFLSASDQYHFYVNNIPVLFFHTGTHSDYHMPNDDEDRIDYNILTKASKSAYSTAFSLANRKKRIKPDLSSAF